MGRNQDSASLIAQDQAASTSDAFTFGKKKKGQPKKGPQTPFTAKGSKGKAVAFKGGKGARGK